MTEDEQMIAAMILSGMGTPIKMPAHLPADFTFEVDDAALSGNVAGWFEALEEVDEFARNLHALGYTVQRWRDEPQRREKFRAFLPGVRFCP